MDRFRNREEAGQKLAMALRAYGKDQPIVLALPRGGVPVGYEVARALAAPLDVWVVRKLGVPWQPELGIGAVAEGGCVHLNSALLEYVGLTESELTELVESKRREVEERVIKFRGNHPAPVLHDRTVIVVDDGIATGGTALAAIRSIRSQHPKTIVLAVPVASPEAISTLAREVEHVVCLMKPENLHAIGLWYVDFAQVPDDEVVRILQRARQEHSRAAHVVHSGERRHERP